MSLKLARDVRCRRIFGDMVVVRQDAAEVLGLNPVGARILELAGEGRGEEEVAAILTREFTVDGQAARADVAAFVEELLEIGVIERGPA